MYRKRLKNSPVIVFFARPPEGGHFSRDHSLGTGSRLALRLSFVVLIAGFGGAFFLRESEEDEEALDGFSSRIGSSVFPGDEWETVSPDEAGMSARRLHRAVAWLEALTAEGDGVEELMIVRHGRVVWAGDQVDRVHGVWSMTKVFTTSLLGLLIEDGLCQLDTPVSEVLPELEATYPDVTFRHLITMTSGYEAAGDWPPENPNYLNGGSSTPFVPSDTPQFAPGSAFSYWDSAFNLSALAMLRLTGEPLDALLARRIADPIGMSAEGWSWPRLTSEDGLDVHADSGNKGKHLELSAREAARFGLLMLNRGRWKDRQVLSADWVDQATSPQVSAETPLGGPIAHLYGKRFPFDGRGCYGFAWWTNGEMPSGVRLWPDLPQRSFAAWGYHNNLILVVPDWDLVLVRLGQDARSSGRLRQGDFNELMKRVGDAIRD